MSYVRVRRWFERWKCSTFRGQCRYTGEPYGEGHCGHPTPMGWYCCNCSRVSIRRPSWQRPEGSP